MRSTVYFVVGALSSMHRDPMPPLIQEVEERSTKGGWHRRKPPAGAQKHVHHPTAKTPRSIKGKR